MAKQNNYVISYMTSHHWKKSWCCTIICKYILHLIPNNSAVSGDLLKSPEMFRVHLIQHNTYFIYAWKKTLIITLQNMKYYNVLHILAFYKYTFQFPIQIQIRKHNYINTKTIASETDTIYIQIRCVFLNFSGTRQ